MTTEQTFTWKGKDKHGKPAGGDLTSSSIKAARLTLLRQGIKPASIRKKGKGLLPPPIARLVTRNAGIKQADITQFVRQLATLVKAGVPLVQSFEVVADGMAKPAMRQLVLQVRDEVASGTTFASAIRKQPQHFDNLFCSLVDAGEQSGALDTLLDRLATWKEKTEALKARVKSAMKYPLVVLLIAGVVSAILLIKVVPQFESIFAGFGAELPPYTQAVVAMSNWMQARWMMLVVGMALALLAWRQAHRKYPGLRAKQDHLALKLPILGRLLEQSCIARFARTLATTWAAGVPLVDALDSAAGAAGNIKYLEAITRIREDVASGTQLNNAMTAAGIFPDMIIQMVAIGEESGSLDAMLDRAASWYEARVDTEVDGLTSLMEPLIMAFLGVVVGGLVIAMYMPIFTMGDAIG